jgi:hypothetical protein
MAEVWHMEDPIIIQHWLFQVLYHSKDLTDWERKFLVDIDKQFHRTGRLSQKQQEIVERIYAEKTH